MWRLECVPHKLQRQCSSSLEDFKHKRREYEKALRKARKDQQLISKRLIRDILEQEEVSGNSESLSKEQADELFQRIHHSGAEKVIALRSVRKALRQKEAQQVFVRLNSFVHVLVGVFSGSNAACQLEAAYCLLELSQSDEASIALACLPATPYLLTFLSGQSPKFTELCLNILGNLAAEKQAVRKQLLAQGVIPSLALCLQSPHVAVVEAAGYALSQLLQGKESSEATVRAVLESSLPSHLLRLLEGTSTSGIGTMIECAWCLHYLVCSNVDNGLLMAQGAAAKCSSLLLELGGVVLKDPAIPQGLQLLISPLLRCLGNLSASHGQECRAYLKDGRILVALCAFVCHFFQQYSFMARESLWVLNNLTAEDAELCSTCIHLNLISVLIYYLPFAKGINVMVLRLLCNIAEKGPEYCKKINQQEVLQAVCATLIMADPEVVQLSLELLWMIVSSSCQVSSSLVNKEGLSALEALQYNKDKEIRVRAAYILDHIFKPGDASCK
ncbi:transmembrane and coiled-coil domain-containing protein 6 [Erpetoichthys calabaricus]|uniref:transmembrane and coiled-coil domain-containing protein 6 n=1 Tax=Erpetoichthys calabaricus TaxID=27687 RepID=UPI00223433A8|nr:transmembrane and coiled-coil domain-containing protein 6 [Erpetoichthys calabaricus]